MDRVEYAHSIDIGENRFDTLFITYFDQLMGLYGFMQPRNYTIKVLSSNEKFIVLDINFSEEESASKTINVLNMLHHSFRIYDRMVLFNMEIVSPLEIKLQIEA